MNILFIVYCCFQSMRAILLDWLRECSDGYKLSRTTLVAANAKCSIETNVTFNASSFAKKCVVINQLFAYLIASCHHDSTFRATR